MAAEIPGCLRCDHETSIKEGPQTAIIAKGVVGHPLVSVLHYVDEAPVQRGRVTCTCTLADGQT